MISQNCRGLTDCKKACKLVRSISSVRNKKGKAPTVACLQETHFINRFALDNLYKGSYAVDDGERNEKGVAILVPEEFEIEEFITSGLGRWVIASLKLKNNDSNQRIVIASLYAPNCV